MSAFAAHSLNSPHYRYIYICRGYLRLWTGIGRGREVAFARGGHGLCGIFAGGYGRLVRTPSVKIELVPVNTLVIFYFVIFSPRDDILGCRCCVFLEVFLRYVI